MKINRITYWSKHFRPFMIWLSVLCPHTKRLKTLFLYQSRPRLHAGQAPDRLRSGLPSPSSGFSLALSKGASPQPRPQPLCADLEPAGTGLAHIQVTAFMKTEDWEGLGTIWTQKEQQSSLSSLTWTISGFDHLKPHHRPHLAPCTQTPQISQLPEHTPLQRRQVRPTKHCLCALLKCPLTHC